MHVALMMTMGVAAFIGSWVGVGRDRVLQLSRLASLKITCLENNHLSKDM